MVEAHCVSDGVSQDDAVCTLIERFSYVSEALLSCSIPDVEGGLGVVYLDALDLEINSDGAEIIALEVVLAVADQHAGLADAAVSYHQVLQRHSLGRHYNSKNCNQETTY